MDMKNLKMFALGLLSALCIGVLGMQSAPPTPDTGDAPADPTPADPTPKKSSKKIKVALLLDTSNSMDGLIDQAKAQLWNIVNELALAKADGQDPDLQIALYQYGNDGLSPEKGYIRQETPFTTNLDLISEKLFSLTTNGGSEFCGHVIHTSLSELDWGNERVDYKTVFIAGNEPFDQGSIAPSRALNLAKMKDVFVNTIYCGDRDGGIVEGWNTPLATAVGSYMSINSDQQTAYVATPYDDEIARLNAQLNETYVWYGSEGLQSFNNMNTQDANAAGYGQSNMVNRALMKNGRFYNSRNDGWDLVDKTNNDPGFKVADVRADQLPEEMRNMSATERVQYVEQKKRQRGAINDQIAALGKQRTLYLESQRATGQEGSLESVMLSAIHDQAGQKGFTFATAQAMGAAEAEFVPSMANFDYFLELAQEVKEYRKDRMVNFTDWLKMSRESNTVILDARGDNHFDAMHIKGAIHLNFAAFNAYDLARLIPDKNTRILIYCNNNIDTRNDAAFAGIRSVAVRNEIERSLVSKAAPMRLSNAEIVRLPNTQYNGVELDPSKSLALNIPVFITLYGYGYTNIYELNEYVKPADPRLVLEGTSIPTDWRASR
jgi:hypothetical protein